MMEKIINCFRRVDDERLKILVKIFYMLGQRDAIKHIDRPDDYIEILLNMPYDVFEKEVIHQ